MIYLAAFLGALLGPLAVWVVCAIGYRMLCRRLDREAREAAQQRVARFDAFVAGLDATRRTRESP